MIPSIGSLGFIVLGEMLLMLLVGFSADSAVLYCLLLLLCLCVHLQLRGWI
jgi:hypothetical protein